MLNASELSNIQAAMLGSANPTVEGFIPRREKARVRSVESLGKSFLMHAMSFDIVVHRTSCDPWINVSVEHEYRLAGYM